MKWIILIVCAVYLFLAGRAKHIYKKRCVPHTNELGFTVGSIVSSATEGIVWFWLFKCMGLIG